MVVYMTLMQQRLLAMAEIHRIPANSLSLAVLYLRMFRVLKYLPDGRWKRAIERTVEELQWPGQKLAFRIVGRDATWLGRALGNLEAVVRPRAIPAQPQ